MIHDIRDIDQNFFPERYKLPYFFRNAEFINLFEKFPPLNYNSELFDSNGFVYTFDDGLKDHIFAAEHLFKIGKRGIFFVPVAPIMNSGFVDSHLIQFIVASSDPKYIEIEIMKIIEKYQIDPDVINSFYKSKWKNNIWTREMIFITRFLREYGSRDFRNKILYELFHKFCQLDLVELIKKFYLDLNEVKYIASLGHLIGGHGNHSFDFRYCTDDEIEVEIDITKDFLSSLGVDDFYYAFANGGYTNFALNILERRGFSKCFTTNHSYNSPFSNKFLLPRIDPSKDL